MRTSLRQVWALLLAVSVVLAGLGIAHANAPMAAGQLDAAQTHQLGDHDAGAHADKTDHRSTHQKMNCHGNADGGSKMPAPQKGEDGGCCHSALPLSVAVRDTSDFLGFGHETERLTPMKDRTDFTVFPEGQFRPPR
ncbi:MAG: hypothetical protein VW268_14705 [Rhodospirillaceae bacterium]